MRKLRKQPVARMDPWNFSLEPGDRVFEWRGADQAFMYDLRESHGRNKRAAGELTPYRVTKDGIARRARRIDGIWYWVDTDPLAGGAASAGKSKLALDTPRRD